jgi:hypothetical protein
LSQSNFILATSGKRGYHADKTEPTIWGAMNDDGIRQQIEVLKIEHRDLDASILALQEQTVPDQLQIARLKRRKLALKDKIMALEDQLVPDIIA